MTGNEERDSERIHQNAFGTLLVVQMLALWTAILFGGFRFTMGVNSAMVLPVLVCVLFRVLVFHDGYPNVRYARVGAMAATIIFVYLGWAIGVILASHHH